MNATSIETFGAILVNDGARSIRLSVSPSEHAHSNLNPGSAADPAGRRPVVSYTGQWNDLHQSCDLVDDEARRAVELAQLYTSIHLGGPAKMVVSWTLTRGDSSGSQVPPIAGPSIFGMFCMAFMRLVAVHARSASKPLSREICDLTAGINTSKLAFSVGFCPSSGRFEKVGKIEQKLEALSARWESRHVALVLSPKTKEFLSAMTEI